jgi:allophanate hydrolase
MLAACRVGLMFPLAAIPMPPPLGIGTVRLENGEMVKCFICEPYALAGSREITSFGGWRTYRAAT